MPAFSHDIKELVLSGINVALEHNFSNLALQFLHFTAGS
jgi:hypothetical protein